ncbi:hypothetical protein BDZ94DRAFT_1165664 [Collybia nuda]|uniref:MYND-type domain-containing protein n=1 Tax=Collybia nuda TaxID=64659 RepID=A0A9P5Y595_9AGAR|nr:hypothetical protein BDZ94DRAFT_1165664 [Collybia nuda]
MAHGSDEKYALNLDDIIAFPDAAHMPVLPPEPGESWILLMEIMEDLSFMGRPVFSVKDITQTSFVVAMYTSNPFHDARNFRIGHTLCITSLRPHHFLDGHTGFRIEDPNTIEILPVSLVRLREINVALRKRSDDGYIQKCIKCNNATEMRCGVCRSLYCTKECQRMDWREHKRQCPVLKTLHRWNRTDWG